MRAWWEGLTAREKRLLGLGVAVVVLSALYLGVWNPIQGEVRRLESQAAGQRSELSWMRQAAAEVSRLRAAGSTPAASGGASLLTVVDRTAREAGLGGALQRVEPDGDQAVRVWLNEAPFNDLVRWLELLWSRQGVTVNRIAVEHGEQSGQVNVRATLARGGS